jgi:hypothetical protein
MARFVYNFGGLVSYDAEATRIISSEQSPLRLEFEDEGGGVATGEKDAILVFFRPGRRRQGGQAIHGKAGVCGRSRGHRAFAGRCTCVE